MLLELSDWVTLNWEVERMLVKNAPAPLLRSRAISPFDFVLYETFRHHQVLKTICPLTIIIGLSSHFGTLERRTLIADDKQGEKFPSYPYASHMKSFLSLTWEGYKAKCFSYCPTSSFFARVQWDWKEDIEEDSVPLDTAKEDQRAWLLLLSSPVSKESLEEAYRSKASF